MWVAKGSRGGGHLKRHRYYVEVTLPFAALRSVLGRSPDDPLVAQILEPVSDFRWIDAKAVGLIASGPTELTGTSRGEGFSLRARLPRDASANGALRIEVISFEPHFTDLPFGLSFGTRKNLSALPPPRRSRLPIHLAGEKWDCDGLVAHVLYEKGDNADDLPIRGISIALPD